ncbi:MAG: O-antigen ligase domain-containing protein [Microcoleaceae cyanobacterium]
MAEAHSLKISPGSDRTAWIALGSYAAFLSFFLLIGAGKLLIPVFPLGGLLVGGFLYFRYPLHYASFTWWMWFLSGFIRRVIDYQSGYLTPGPWTLTPLLVTLISGLTFARQLTKAHRQGGFPFILCCVSLCYGFLIGLIYNPVNRATLQFLFWLAPVLFGFHLFVNWRDYPRYRQNIQQTFLWGTLVMGLYGVWQFLVAPEWERFFLRNIDSYSFGQPQPLGIRVFSTMNSPQTFANALEAGLIILLTVEGILPYFTAGLGFLTFLLSRARAAWLGWFVGMATFVPSLKPQLQMRIVVSILLASLIIVPVTQIEPFATTIQARLESFSNIENDTSLEARSEGYSQSLDLALSETVGQGMGNSAGFLGNDSGILKVLFSLGWFGAIPYTLGLLLLFLTVFQSSRIGSDALASAARGIALGTFAQIGFNPVLEGAIGMMLWGFLGLSLAAHKYYLASQSRFIE